MMVATDALGNCHVIFTTWRSFPSILTKAQAEGSPCQKFHLPLHLNVPQNEYRYGGYGPVRDDVDHGDDVGEHHNQILADACS